MRQIIHTLPEAACWMLGISPFHQVGSVPAASFRAAPAAVMLALAATALAAALAVFRNRDLVGA
jgi:hypothetical protein